MMSTARCPAGVSESTHVPPVRTRYGFGVAWTEKARSLTLYTRPPDPTLPQGLLGLILAPTPSLASLHAVSKTQQALPPWPLPLLPIPLPECSFPAAVLRASSSSSFRPTLKCHSLWKASVATAYNSRPHREPQTSQPCSVSSVAPALECQLPEGGDCGFVHGPPRDLAGSGHSVNVCE